MLLNPKAPRWITHYWKSQILNHMWKFCRLIILQYIFRNLYRHEKFEASTKDYCLSVCYTFEVWQKCFVVEETAALVLIHPDDGGRRFLWNTGTLNTARLKRVTSQMAVKFCRHCLKNKTKTSYRNIFWWCMYTRVPWWWYSVISIILGT